MRCDVHACYVEHIYVYINAVSVHGNDNESTAEQGAQHARTAAQTAELALCVRQHILFRKWKRGSASDWRLPIFSVAVFFVCCFCVVL